MYVNPFLLGIFTTIGVEAIALIIIALISVWGKK